MERLRSLREKGIFKSEDTEVVSAESAIPALTPIIEEPSAASEESLVELPPLEPIDESIPQKQLPPAVRSADPAELKRKISELKSKLKQEQASAEDDIECPICKGDIPLLDVQPDVTVVCPHCGQTGVIEF